MVSADGRFVFLIVGGLSAFLAVLPFIIDYPSNRTSCSGRGHKWPDSPNICECDQCFTGANCEVEISPCEIVARGGSPVAFQSYWSYDNTWDDVLILTDYRLGYLLDEISSDPEHSTQNGLATQLDKVIRDMHKTANNAETEGYSIVLGAGATQLIAAATYAALQKANGPIKIFADSPYYNGYKDWADVFPRETSFTSKRDLEPIDLIEFVTVPNNPDGKPREAVYPKATLVVHDLVYHWPYIVKNITKRADDVMIFSMSKLTGHASTRLGWALVKDPQVASLMHKFICLSQLHLSVESQFRTLRLLERASEDSDKLFKELANILQSRWQRINQFFHRQRNLLQLAETGTYYMWIKCLGVSDCAALFKQAGVLGEEGEMFGATNQFLRIEIVMEDSAFDIMMRNLDTYFSRN